MYELETFGSLEIAFNPGMFCILCMQSTQGAMLHQQHNVSYTGSLYVETGTSVHGKSGDFIKCHWLLVHGVGCQLTGVRCSCRWERIAVEGALGPWVGCVKRSGVCASWLQRSGRSLGVMQFPWSLLWWWLIGSGCWTHWLLSIALSVRLHASHPWVKLCKHPLCIV